MQREEMEILRIRRDWLSKLTDGVVVAFMLVLLWLVVALVVWPIEQVFGRPGLLVYGLGLLAVAMFSLQQALFSTNSETTRTWYGIAAGFLAWSVANVATRLGVLLSGPGGFLLWIMAVLVTVLFWRSFMPVSARFFSLTFLLCWTLFLMVDVKAGLSKLSPVFTLLYKATGYLAILAALLVLGWILFQSRHRTQRVTGALAVWFFVILCLSVLNGPLF